MSKQNVVDAQFEEFIAMKCATFANLKYVVTPDNTRYDFWLQTDKDILVLAEIKTRAKLFPDWFIEKDKSEWLLEACKLFRCAPWYIIHCEPNKTTYQINLNHEFKYRTGDMYGEPGIFVLREYWRVIPKLGSSDAPMSPLDWK